MRARLCFKHQHQRQGAASSQVYGVNFVLFLSSALVVKVKLSSDKESCIGGAQGRADSDK